MEQAPGSSLKLVGGDLNAEFGTDRDREWEDVLGLHGMPRRSTSRKEWLEWCRQGKYLDAGSQFAQGERGTWWHPRSDTAHTLDHLFLDQADRWHLVSCKVIHAGRQRTHAQVNDLWNCGLYTDHHPVVATLRQGKLWAPQEQRSPP